MVKIPFLFKSAPFLILSVLISVGCGFDLINGLNNYDRPKEGNTNSPSAPIDGDEPERKRLGIGGTRNSSEDPHSGKNTASTKKNHTAGENSSRTPDQDSPTNNGQGTEKNPSDNRDQNRDGSEQGKGENENQDPSPPQAFISSILFSDLQPDLGGNLCIAVFDSEEGFPYEEGAAIIETCLPISDVLGGIDLEVPQIGRYAVAIFHDENTDEVLNTVGSQKLPLEGFGFTNYKELQIGAPDFSDVSTQLGDDGTVTIKLFYLGI